MRYKRHVWERFGSINYLCIFGIYMYVCCAIHFRMYFNVPWNVEYVVKIKNSDKFIFLC